MPRPPCWRRPRLAPPGGGRGGCRASRCTPGIHRMPAQRLARRELARAIYQPSFWSGLNRDIFGWLNSLQIGSQKSGVVGADRADRRRRPGHRGRAVPDRPDARTPARAGRGRAGRRAQLTRRRLPPGGRAAGRRAATTPGPSSSASGPSRWSWRLAACCCRGRAGPPASWPPRRRARCRTTPPGCGTAARLFDDVRYGDRAGTAGGLSAGPAPRPEHPVGPDARRRGGGAGGRPDVAGRAGGAGLMP